MSRRMAGALVAMIAGIAVTAVGAGGQAPASTAAKPASPAKAAYSPSRTPDGQPDVQGYWTNATYTPLERPAEFAGREFMTEAEAIAYQKKKSSRTTASRRKTSTTTTCRSFRPAGMW